MEDPFVVHWLEPPAESVVQTFEVLQYWMLPPENWSEPWVVAPQVPVPILMAPFTSRRVCGFEVPTPTFPAEEIRIRSVPLVVTLMSLAPLVPRTKTFWY